MDSGASGWRIGVGVALSLVAVSLAGFAALVIYGLTVEYGGGDLGGPADAVMLVGIPALVALLAVGVLPLRGRVRGGALVGFVAVTIGAIYVGHLLGVAGNTDRQEAQSRDFVCDRRTAARVDKAFETLPRPFPIYGPLEGSRTSCTAGINGPGGEVLKAYRTALPQQGWELTPEEGREVVAQREDLTAKVYLDCGAAQAADQCTALVQITLTGAEMPGEVVE